MLIRGLLVFGGLALLLRGAETKPNFGGMWKVADSQSSIVYVIDQSEARLRMVMFIDDDLGARILDFQAPIDGQSHPQVLNGESGDFRAEWQGDALYFETGRTTSDGVRRIRRVMSLADDGKTIAVQWTRTMPLPEESGIERWERQDPKAASATLFTARDELQKLDGSLRGPQISVARGLLAAVFNDMPTAERELLPVIRKSPGSDYAKSAREALSGMYWLNSKTHKAFGQCRGDGCTLLRQLIRYPELSVAHHGYGRVQLVKQPDGKILAPVMANGKEGQYQVDTGSSMSLLRLSEASRLGLKLEPVTMGVQDIAGAHHDGYLAILRNLSIGQMRLKNATFWVVPDARLDVPGVLGIDILVKFQTLRWNSKGVFEVGFAAGRKNIREANLVFLGDVPVAEASSNGRSGLSFVLDTGMTSSYFFPRFATQFLDFVAANGRQSVYQIHGEAGESKLKELTVPEVQLHVGATDLKIRSADVLLERAPLWDEQNYGLIGIDLLSRAQSVTLDFQAMRLTLQGVVN